MRTSLVAALLAASALSPVLAQTTTDGKNLTAAEIALGLLSGTIKQTSTFSAAGSAASTGQSTVIGSGPDELTLQVSQQRYNGDAVASVLVDGKPAGAFSISALQGQGDDTVTLRGSWGAGQHDVRVVFQDDFDPKADWSDPGKVIAAGGHDRNVFVDRVSYNGREVSNGTLALYNGKSQGSFSLTGSAASSGTGTQGAAGGAVTETGTPASGGTGATNQTSGAPQADLSGGTVQSGGMTDEQLRQLAVVLNGGKDPNAPQTSGQMTQAQAAQTVANNPLLSAAAAQGQDVTPYIEQAAQDAAGNTQAQVPSLTGFTVQWVEDFTKGNCTGLLSNVWGPGIKCATPGQIEVHSTGDNQDSGAETRPPGYGGGKPGGGWGYGLYSFTLKVTGAARPGPYALLWPGTDAWPGPELDVMEVTEDGTPYGTVHWKDGGGGNAFRSVQYQGVNPMEVHTYSILWLPGSIRFLVDGKQYGDPITDNVPADGAHGGEQEAPGVGMQTWWNSGAAHGVGMEVYNVSYATADVAQAGR